MLVLMLTQRQRRWAISKPTLCQRLFFARCVLSANTILEVRVLCVAYCFAVNNTIIIFWELGTFFFLDLKAIKH